MNELLIKCLEILQASRPYPLVRKIFSILFILNISSFFYKKFWGEYKWIDYNDYQAILSFIIDGKYFIPFLLVVLVYIAAYWVPKWLFSIWNSRKHFSTISDLKNHKFEPGEFEERLNHFIKIIRKLIQYKLTKGEIEEFYLEHKNVIISEFYFKLSEELRNLRNLRNELQEYFTVGCQLLLLCLLYFNVSPFFIVFFFIVMLIALWGIGKFYWIISILPTLAEKVALEMRIYMADKQNQL